MKELTVGVPCYNEELTVGKVVDDFRRVFPAARILVIDNASTDRTAEVAREHGVEVVREDRKGKGFAVQRLFRLATSQLLLMVDGDDTYPAEEAPKLIAALGPGVDTVVGRRAGTDPAAYKAAHTWANKLLSWFIERIFRQPTGDLFSGFRLFRRTFYKNVPLLATGFEVETELTLQTLDKRFVQREVGIDFRSRPAGSVSKLSTLPDGLRVVRVILVLIKDYKPLVFFGSFAVVLAALAFFFGSFPMLDYIRHRYVFHLPLAVLAMGTGLLAALSATCGLILDTIVRQRRETFWLRMRKVPEEE